MSPTETPATVTREDVLHAATLIEGHVRRTPVLELEPEALGLPTPIWLKLDLLQPSGSFKARGAFALLRSREVPAAGVVAASGGNFGLAVAYAARRLGHPATVFVPSTTPREKTEGIRTLGATVEVVPGYYAEALLASHECCDRTGALFAHAYDQREIVAGAGTCALELEEQCPGVDTVLVAVGGGGLIGGIATWFAGQVRVIGVETDRTPTLHAARGAGGPVDVEVGGLAASALGARRLGDLAWAAARRFVADSVLVGDDDLRMAQQRLWDATRLLAEPAGVAPLAALLTGAYRAAPDERVAVVVCGANVDPASLGRTAT